MSLMQPNPGAVAGPGKLTKRTDLPPKQGIKRLPNPAYGEQKEFMGQQAAAPMAAAGNPLGGNVVPLNAPTQRPNEPVTAGVDAGPGPGSEILGMKTPIDTQLQDLSVLAKYMPLMAQFADSPQSSGTMKAFVNYLRSQSE
jgi:hypothetical protein